MALGLLGLAPTELSAQTFAQYKGGYVWLPTVWDSASSWRSASPTAGALIGDLRDVEAEGGRGYYLGVDGSLSGQRVSGVGQQVERLVTGISGIVEIEAGGNLVVALTSTGEVWALEPFTSSISPVRIDLPPIKQIVSDESELFAVSIAGGLYTFRAGIPVMVQSGVKLVSRSSEGNTAIVTNDGAVYELDAFSRLIPQLLPSPVGGLSLTITSLAYAAGLFAAVDASGDVYVWPRASLAMAQIPHATKLPDVFNVAELQLTRASGGALLPSGNLANNVFLTFRTKNRKLFTGRLVGVVPSGSSPSELIVPQTLNLVEHVGDWDGFDRDLGQMIAFSRSGADPSGSLAADIVRQPNNASGTRFYKVTLKLTGAPDGTFAGFRVLSDHRPAGVGLNDISYVRLVNGVANFEFMLTNPRGVFRASAFIDANGNRQNDSFEPISMVEVK